MSQDSTISALPSASTLTGSEIVPIDQGATKQTTASQIAALSNASIAAETAARIAADNSEAATRAANDTTLQTNITSEASTRASADTTITTNLAASSGSSLVGFTVAGTGAVTRTVQSKERDIVSAADFALDDGSDQSTQLQQVLTNLGVLGGTLYFPTPSVRWAWATGLKVPYGVKLLGTNPWGCILRYTGTGSAFTADGTNNNNNVAFQDFNLQLSGVGAFGFDYSRFQSSQMTSVVITSQNTGQRGISANITNTAWNAFYNNFFGVYFNGTFADAVFVDSSVAQQANAWKWYSPHFLGCINGATINNVQEMTIYSPHAETITGNMFGLGASASRVNIFDARMEAVGGNMFSINDACSRLMVRGIKVLAGSINTSGKWGVRADVDPCDWDNQTVNTDAAVTTPTGGHAYLSGSGIQHYGTIGLSSTTTLSNNLRGQATFAGAGTVTVTFSVNEPNGTYFVSISGNAAETFWVTGKGTTGFTLHSSNAASVAVVDWHLIR